MRFLLCSFALAGAMAIADASAQASAATPSAASTAPVAAPAEANALVSEPPGTDAAPPPQMSVSADPPPPLQRIGAMLGELKVTDLVVALFALLMTLALMRVASAVARLRKAATSQAENNRKAVEAMQKAADAAARSAESADMTAGAVLNSVERQLRAYVTVRQFIQAPMKDERGHHGWLLQVVWQNTGQTPTKGFRYWAMLREFDRAIPVDFEFTPAGLKDFAGGELGSSASVNSPPLLVSPQLISKLQDGSRKVLLLGQADYDDVLGNNTPRETRFCVEVMLMNDPSGANGSPFSFTYHPRHNIVT